MNASPVSLAVGVLDIPAPLRLGHLGLADSAIGAIFLAAATLQAGASLGVGRWDQQSCRQRMPTAPVIVTML